MAKKFTRIAVVAFALCVLLALSSLAYGIDLKGRVTGLEDGTEYKYAQYDFVANAYGEFAELTADTELTSGIWGIKAGDAEPEAVFVSTTDSGYINFFSNETGLQMNDIFGGKNDDYVPGKWTISTDGIYDSITRYLATQEVQLNVAKDKYQVQSDVQKTVKKGDVTYNVYLIDEAEYYLKAVTEGEGEEAVTTNKYFAVADDALYEGEGEAVAVMTKTWVNCQPIIGEENRLQESVVRYGFTNEQIVPAKDVVKFVPEGTTPKTGAMFYHTNENGYTYTDADFKGTFTFVVKNIGSAEETRYTIDIAKATKEFVAPAEMAESDGYLVALEYAPYANCPDDIFHGHPTDTSRLCYAYINLYAGRNVIDFNEVLLPAPTVYDGYGTIAYESEYDIEIAPVTISADGTGIAFGEWTDYEYDIAATRDMVGLYAVRAKYGAKVSDYALAYAYGEKDGRKALGSLDPATNRVAVKTGGFVPGFWSNTPWKGSGGINTHSTFGQWRLGTTGGQVTGTTTIALKNAFTALAELKTAETPDAEAIAAAEAALLKAQKTVAEQYSVANYTYGYLAEDIINVKEATSLYYTWYQNNANVVFDKARVKLIAYVADREGNVTPYSTVQEHAYSSGKTISGTFKFQDFLPEEGWIVAIQVYPCSDIAPEEITRVASTGQGRMLLNVEQSYYTITDAPELPASGDKPEGLYIEGGVVKGFDANKRYAWAPFSLSGYSFSDWTVLPEGITEYDFDRPGAVAIMFQGDGYTNSGSEIVNIAFGGNDDDILNLVTKNTTKQKTVTVDGTAYNVFTIDGAEYYLNGDKYYAVADNSEYTGANAASAAKVFITKDVPPTVYLSNNNENLYNVKFTEGMYSGIVLSNNLALIHGFSALVLGTTDTPISNTYATAIQTAVASGNEAAIATARQNAAKISNAIYYSYAFTPEEVIKMSDFESLTYSAVLRQGGFKLVGSVQTKIVFKVIDENGDLVDRVVYKPAAYNTSGVTTTVYASDFDDVSGHIVGIVFYPYVLTDGSYFDYFAKTNGDYDIYLYSDFYKVTRTLDPEKSPEGVVFEGNKITGLDADETYVYGHYTIAGKQGEWTTVTGVTEITHDLTGLIGISIVGDGITTSDSKPVVGYLEGDAALRSEIGNVVDGKPLYDASKRDFWKAGVWTGDYLSWHDQVTGAYSFLDQDPGIGCEDVQTLWLYQNDKQYVLDKLAADAAQTIPSHWVTYKVTSNPDRLKAVVEKHYAAENYAENLAVNKLALQTKMANAVATRNISYAFDETEILPVNEFVSMAFTSKRRQGGVSYSSVKSKAVVYVMDENAEVTSYEWWSDAWALTQTGAWQKITVDVQSIEGLPEEGWVVGVQFYPWAEVEPSGIVAASEARIDANNIAYSFGKQHVCIGYYPAEYVIAVAAPEVSFDAETGIVSGFEADKTYQYAPYSINGMGDAVAVEAGATTLQLTEGLWAITEIVNGIVSQPAVVYFRTDRSTMAEIGTIIEEKNYKHYDYVGGDVWEQGKWSGLHAGVHSSFGSTYAIGTLGGHIWSAGAKALYEATDDTTRAAAIAQILGDANAVNFRYAYAADEIIEARDLLQIAFKTTRRMGSLTLGQATAEVVFYIADETGAISEYTWTSDRYNAQAGGNFNVATHTIENWPTEGWVVGLQIKPWQDLDPDGLVSKPEFKDGKNNFYSTMCTMTFVPDSYKIVTGDEVAEAPALTLTSTNNIKVTNYNSVLTYVYSTDEGKTWTEFENGVLVCTKASTEYQIKSLAGYPYPESEVATVTSRPVAVVGSTLVLDGRIATRVYLEVDETLVDPKTITFHATKVNSDFTGTELGRVYGNSSQTLDWMSARGYDEEKGLHYFTIYTPAKDADNITLETELNYYVGETKHVHGSVGFNFKVTGYIATAKALAEAGDAEFVAALPLVEALETYVAYADNYFNKGTDDAYTSTATTEGVEAATRTNATLTGVEFYGTSLLLEDQVTIRHYFAVSDIDAFNAAYDVAGKYSVKGNFIYFDIADIPAQEIGKVQTLTIADAEGNTAYTVTYSATNYIVDMMGDDDANLVSLVNAMYDYYLAAVDYTK